MVKKSRYKDAKPFVGENGAQPVFLGHRPREIGPATGIVEHRVTEGERLDELAKHYYNEPRLWWRIVDANPEILYGGDLVQRDNYPLPTDFNEPLTFELPPIDADDPEKKAEKQLYLDKMVIHPTMVGQVIRIPRGRE